VKLKTNRNDSGENQPSNLIIDKILGRGLTCIGSTEPFYRHILQEQMALSIATGRPFLGCFETAQHKVLILRNGRADCLRTEKRLGLENTNEDKSASLIIKENERHLRVKPSIKTEAKDDLDGYIFDIMSYLLTAKNVHNIGVFIIPDFIDFRMSCKSYLENEFKGYESTYAEESLKSPKLQNIDYHRDVDSVEHLRNFAAWENISIITGHDIGTRGGFSYSRGPLYADQKIYLVKNCKGWELKIPSNDYVPTSNVKMEYNDFNYFQITEEEKEKMANLSLLDSEKEIISYLIKNGPTRFMDIVSKTGLPNSTVVQKLKALQEDKKGCWITHKDGFYRAVRKDCSWLNR
jgi:hypothetical protein